LSIPLSALSVEVGRDANLAKPKEFSRASDEVRGVSIKPGLATFETPDSA